jgi:hypothetical protein
MRYHVVNTSKYNNGKVIFSTNNKAKAKLLADNIGDSFMLSKTGKCERYILLREQSLNSQSLLLYIPILP